MFKKKADLLQTVVDSVDRSTYKQLISVISIQSSPAYFVYNSNKLNVHTINEFVFICCIMPAYNCNKCTIVLKSIFKEIWSLCLKFSKLVKTELDPRPPGSDKFTN